MPTFEGYDDAPATAVWNDSQVEVLQAYEDDLGVDIVVTYGNNTSQLPTPYEDGDPIRIYDFAGPSITGAPQRRDHWYFTLEEGGATQYLALDRNRYIVPRSELPYDEVNAGYANSDYAHAWIDYGTMWLRLHGSNLLATQGQSITTVMNKFIGDHLHKVISKQYFDEREARMLEEVRVQFLNFAEAAANQRVTRYRNDIRTYEQQIQAAQAQAVTLAVNVRNTQRDLDSALEMARVDMEGLGAGIEELQSNIKFETVAWSSADSALVIHTKPLWMYAPGKQERTPLGAMRVKFYFTDRMVRVENVTNPKQSRHHPHVPANGDPCFGSMEMTFRHLLRDAEIVPLFENLIIYLEQFNPEDSWGRWAASWFDTQTDTTEFLVEGEWKTRAQIAEQATAQIGDAALEDIAETTTEEALAEELGLA